MPGMRGVPWWVYAGYGGVPWGMVGRYTLVGMVGRYTLVYMPVYPWWPYYPVYIPYYTLMGTPAVPRATSVLPTVHPVAGRRCPGL